MSGKSTDSERQKFCNDLVHFVSEAITGAIIAYIKCIGIPQDASQSESTLSVNMSNMLVYFNRVYLNSCWYLYGKKEDVSIVESFDKILSYQIIKGTACLIHWIDHICLTVFSLNITKQVMHELKTIDEHNKRKYVLKVMENVMKTLLEKNGNSIGCNGDDACQNEYNNVDFYEFTETGMDDENNDDDKDDSGDEYTEDDNEDNNN